MPTDGATVMNALDQALADATTDVTASEDQSAALDRQLDELVAHRGETLVELSRHYLPSITQQTIDATFVEVRDDLQNIIARRQRQERLVQDQIAAISTTRDQLNEQLTTCTEELNLVVDQRTRAEAELDKRLRANAEFQRLSEQLAETRFQLDENERRLAEIHAEAKEKLPAYEQSRLFQYLHARKFGEPQYRSRGLIRRLDRWVAGLIDFGRARQSYRFLSVTPALADAEVRHRRDELEKLDADVERIDRATSSECGLPEIVQRGQRLGDQRDLILDRLDQNRQELEPLESELAALVQSQGAFYDEAITRFKEFLDQTHTVVLEQRAAATPESVDDEIVAQIKWLDEQIDEHKRQMPISRKQRRAAEQRVRGLRYVTRRGRRSNIDSQRCYFEDDFDISRVLDQFRDAQIDEHKLLRTIRDHVRFHPTWAEEAGKTIGQAFETPTAQKVVGAAGAVASEGLRRVVNRHSRGFTRDRGF